MNFVRAGFLVLCVSFLYPSLTQAQTWVWPYYGPPYTTTMVPTFFCRTPPYSYATPSEVVDRWTADSIACASNSNFPYLYTTVTVDHTEPSEILKVVGNWYWASPVTIEVVGHGYNFDAPKNLGPPCNCAGDPINLGTGNEFRDDEDTDSGALAFHRYYNSHYAATTRHIGFNWRHSFDRTLEYFIGGAAASSADISRPDGRVIHFNLQAGLWQADPDVSDRLTQQTDAVGNTTGWTFFEAASRSQETYDASGKLTSIANSDGLITTLTYSTSSTPASIAPVAGLLITVTDPRGRALSLAYNADSTISTLVEPDGSVVTYAYDTNGNLSRVTYPDQSSRQYVYNESALTQNTSLPHALTGDIDETGTRFTSIGYNSQGQATMSMLASNINVTQVAYTSSGQEYAGYPATVTYPSGTKSSFHFTIANGSVHTSSASAPCGPGCGQPNASAALDVNGYPASTTDFNGNITKTTYDPTGLLNQQIDAYGSTSQRTTNTTWDTTLRMPLARTVLDANNLAVSSTQWTYNALGQVLARCEIDPANSTSAGYSCSADGTPPTGVRRWTYTYCTSADGTQCPLVGLLLTVTGPRTDLTQATSFSYYLSSSASGCGTPGAACHQMGDLYQVTDAVGHVTTYASYDASGRATRITDANGVNTDMTYTSRGWLATRTIGGAKTTITYTPYGAVATTTDPDGVKVTYTYDTAHRLTDITDALGNRIHYTLDAASNKTAEQTYDSGGALRRSLAGIYNTLGQLTKITDGMNNAVFNAAYADSYDANGNLVHTTDALGVQRKLGYDGLNRLVSTLDNYSGTDTATQNAQSVFSYDTHDRLKSVGDPDGLGTSYSYDGLGNTTTLQSPDTGTTTDGYDAAGNVIQRTDAKGVTSYNTYDPLDRRTAATYVDSTLNVAYAYDEPNSTTGCLGSYPFGRLTRVIEVNVTTIYCYDQRGNVTRKSQLQGTVTDATAYTYTLADRLASTVTAAGTSIQYSRDAAGRISGVTALRPGASASTVVTAISYLPFGPITNYTLGNGQAVTRAYNANYALTDVVSPAFSLHIARNAMNNIIALGSTSGFTSPVETYNYDPLYRITGVYGSKGAAVEAYAYSKAGDRVSKTSSGVGTGTYSYQNGTHHLASIGSAARAYDANGNTTGSTIGGNTFGYGYNGRNRMTVVQRNGATVGTYTYNALGQRTAKSATFPSTFNQRFVYDESSQLLGEYGTSNREYIWLDDVPVAIVDTSGTTSTMSYVHADGLNTPRAVSGSTGKTVWSWPYQSNPFGEQLPTSARGFSFNLRFPGQYYDAESGLSDNGFRSYEAATGRFLQSDPIGLDGGISTYAYVGGNPLSYTDPSGLQVLVPIVRPAPPFLMSEVPQPTRNYPKDDWVSLCLAAGPACVAPVIGAMAVTPTSNVVPFPANLTRSSPNTCPPDNNNDRCYDQYEAETEVCNAVTRRRGPIKGQACHASATQRLAACERGQPLPPLNTYNN